jgi:hypothetical protein
VTLARRKFVFPDGAVDFEFTHQVSKATFDHAVTRNGSYWVEGLLVGACLDMLSGVAFASSLAGKGPAGAHGSLIVLRHLDNAR